jgi:hypothetical protein
MCWCCVRASSVLRHVGVLTPILCIICFVSGRSWNRYTVVQLRQQSVYSSEIIIIIIIIIIPFMQGIHTYIPETNHVSRVHSVAAILRVLLMVHIALSF